MTRWAALLLMVGSVACGEDSGSSSTGTDSGVDAGVDAGADTSRVDLVADSTFDSGEVSQSLDCSENLAETGTNPDTWDWGPDGNGCPPEVVSLTITGELEAGVFWVRGAFTWRDRESDVVRMDSYCFHEEDLEAQDGAIASGLIPGQGETFTPTDDTGSFEVGTVEPEGDIICDLWLIDSKGNISPQARELLR